MFLMDCRYTQLDFLYVPVPGEEKSLASHDGANTLNKQQELSK